MKTLFFAFVLLFFTGCATKKYYNTSKSYVINGKKYYPLDSVSIGWTQKGIASWYGADFHGRYTSNGEIYNMYAYTAAHKTLPMNTIVKVINLQNNKSVIVRINDRGPFVKGRIIDLSYAAGKKIGLDVMGIAPVKIVVVGFKGKNYVSGYKIQIGAFLSKTNALNAAKKYQKLGYNTNIIKVGNFYKIYITGFKSYKQAKEFKLKNKINGFIVGD